MPDTHFSGNVDAAGFKIDGTAVLDNLHIITIVCGDLTGGGSASGKSITPIGYEVDEVLGVGLTCATCSNSTDIDVTVGYTTDVDAYATHTLPTGNKTQYQLAANGAGTTVDTAAIQVALTSSTTGAMTNPVVYVMVKLKAA